MADPDDVEITGTLSLYLEHQEVYRYTEDLKAGRPKQVSDVYISKLAMGGHPPDQITFRFAWTKPTEAEEDEDAKEEPWP